ncbi:MAG: hypothetical protein HQL56_18960, partial [Magnetococcales bacterium]|nr:hypothetical protein [Magnetococcales bacterium]
DLWESPELQRGLNRLALQDIGRQHPDWDLSILEPMARGGSLAGIGNLLKGMTGQIPTNGFPNTMMAAAENPESRPERGSDEWREEKLKEWNTGIDVLASRASPVVKGVIKVGRGILGWLDDTFHITKEGLGKNLGHDAFENCQTESCLRQGTERSTDHIDARDKKKLEEQQKGK